MVPQGSPFGFHDSATIQTRDVYGLLIVEKQIMHASHGVKSGKKLLRSHLRFAAFPIDRAAGSHTLHKVGKLALMKFFGGSVRL